MRGLRRLWAILAGLLIAVALLVPGEPTSGQTTPADPPAAPQGLAGVAATPSVTLSWDDPGDASITGYQVLRRNRAVDATGVFHILIADTGTTSTSYVDTTVQPEASYAGLGPASSFTQVDQADTTAPATLAVSSLSCSVHLSWDVPVTAAETVTGYRVLRANGSEAMSTLVDDTGSIDSDYRDFEVEAGATYSYRVQALRSGVASAESNLAEVTVPQPPTPTTITVNATPMVVNSTTADYFVLYVMHEYKSMEHWIPVRVVRGQDGTTTVAEKAPALPLARYQLEQYQVANPADIDHDCIDDLTELNSLGQMNPVNPAPSVASSDGAVGIPDMATFESLARDNQGKSYVTYVQFGINTSRPRLYFVNTSRYPIYGDFMETTGRISDPWTRAGTITYDPDLLAPNGSQGAFYFGIGAYADFLSLSARTYTLLAASMPLIDNNLVWHVENYRLPEIQSDLPWIRASRFGLVTDVDVRPDTAFLKLNAKEGYGRLQVATPGYRPSPLQIMIYETLPTTVPRIAGIISTIPQTALSLLNLRALQSGVPNAVVSDALEKPYITSLIGSFVQYEVTEYGWVVRAATPEQAEAHYESSRPADTQTPARDLSLTEITALSDIGFNDRSAFGVKAANVAVLRTLGLPSGTVPDGFAIPFYFYDEFMTTHDFYDRIEDMLADEEFQSDHDIQANKLQELRDDIEDSASPNFIIEALTAMHAAFPHGSMLRYRPSTNNEDLSNFNGAGLYDSATQNIGSTEIDRSFKEVLASLWTYRAFTEREFHRIDHLSAAMGVLVYSGISSERTNGSAVSFDPVSDNAEFYYLNVYPAQDQLTALVDGPSPEEWLLRNNDRYQILGSSNQVDSGTLLLKDPHLEQLRQHLESIHDHFRVLYNPAAGERFAMEIAFRINSDDILSIEQARPWVFSPTTATTTTTTTTTTTVGGGGGGGGPSGPTPSDVDFEWNVTRDIEELDSGHGSPTGAWSDDTILWLAENGDGADDAVYAYDLGSGERREELEFELDDANLAPRGLWSDRRTIWISDSGKEKLFAHDLESGERLPDSDLALHPDNDDPRGIWSDGSTMWVLDGRDDALFGYDLVSGELLAGYALHDDNDDPHGLWSDGVSAWVSDDGAKRLFAYRLPSIAQEEAGEDENLALERVRDEEFWKLPRVSNNSPRGLWSDGDVMYVADENDDKVYSYNMPDVIDAWLASLTLSDVEIGEFDSAQTEYAGTAGDDVTETTVGAEALQSGATVLVEPDDGDGDPENGHQIALEEVSEITVTVTSADGSRERVYRVLVGDPAQEAPDGSAPPCFRGAVALGFSLVVYAGGSVEELVDCAQSRHGTALYTLHDGGYVPYILGAPEFVNSSFGELFAGGVPATTPLIIKSEGPPTADPAESITGDDPTPPWPECLRGTAATGFSLVLYQGGAIEELVACAESRDITAIYALDEGGYFPYILGAPEFVNRAFRELFTGGVPATAPLIVKSDGVSAAGATAGAP